VFVAGKLFQPSLMFAVKDGAYPSEALLIKVLLSRALS
jgi:hypothetical protein